ncbi:MAG: hypothetical protein JSR21_19070 [Proteobacteria bacterium]|nr:hypothetical protein [Pseudomonadota bacterium]
MNNPSVAAFAVLLLAGALLLVRVPRSLALPIKAALNLAILGAIAWIWLAYWRYALVAPPGFDGAMNLNTARSFATGHGYGFVYNMFFPFPAQTDGPFVLPAALLYRLLGATPLAAQGVNFGYFVGMTILAFVLIRRVAGSVTLGLLGALLVLQTPGMAEFAMNGFGEIPTFFWFLAGLIVLGEALDSPGTGRMRLFSGGAALALCYLTKTVALLMVAPTALIFAALLLSPLRNGRGRIEPLAWFAAGLVLPVAGWELFRLIELGPSEYAEWWRLQLGQIFRQSGASDTLNERISPLAKGAKHFLILSGLLEMPPSALLALLLAPWLSAAALMAASWRRREVGHLFGLAACVAVAVLYFVWWLFITPTDMAWLRRIINGLLIQQVLLAISVAAAVRLLLLAAPGRPGGRAAAAAAALVVLLIPELFVVHRARAFTEPPALTPQSADEMALARTIRQLPQDATLFGFGWWQNPTIAFFSGRTMMNWNHWTPAAINRLPSKYLVLDSSAKIFAGADAKRDILDSTEHTLIADGPGGSLYRIDKALPYPAFTDADRASGKLAAAFAPSDGPYIGRRGFYEPESTLDWSRPESALLLRRTGQTRLALALYIPPNTVPDTPGKSLALRVTSPNCLDATVPLDTPGAHRIDLPLGCPPVSTPEPMEIDFAFNGHIRFTRQIDADSRLLGFALTEARLVGP